MDTQNNVDYCTNTNKVNDEDEINGDTNLKNVCNKDNVGIDEAQSLKSDDNIENSITDTNNVQDHSNNFHETSSNDSLSATSDKLTGSVIIKNIDNTSLCNLLLYSSEDDSHTETSEFESNDEEEDSQQGAVGKTVDKIPKANIDVALKKISELGLDELPPVPDLTELKVDVTGEDCEQMGVVSSIVDRLVIIESLPNIPAYDIDTLLFLQNGKVALGYVHDVLGPVSSPMYAVRFNTREEIDTLNISKGLPVYSAPKTEHTQYVFLKQLLETKGSDASWTDDAEVPPEFADFSDDESESAAKKKHLYDLNPNRKRNSFDKHKSFEKNMNVRNILDSRLHKIRDSYEPQNKKHLPNSKISHTSKQNYQTCLQNPFRFTPMSGINNVPSLQQVHTYYRMPPYGMGPNVFPAPNYRNIPFVPFTSPPPMAPPNVPHFHTARPLPPSTVFLNPPPPGVDVPQPHEPQQLMMHLTPSTASNQPNLQPFYNTPPPPPQHVNWYMSNNLTPTSSGTFTGMPYYQKP